MTELSNQYFSISLSDTILIYKKSNEKYSLEHEVELKGHCRMNIKENNDELIYANKIEDPDLIKVVFYNYKNEEEIWVIPQLNLDKNGIKYKFSEEMVFASYKKIL